MKTLKRATPRRRGSAREPTDAMVLHVGGLVAENVYVRAGGKNYLYDLHSLPDGDGLMMTTEVVGYDEKGLGRLPGGTIPLGEDAYLLPYSGFTFASKDSQPYPDVAADDHIYYQGPVLRGVELVVEGEDRASLRERTEGLIPVALKRLTRLMRPRRRPRPPAERGVTRPA